MSQKTENSVEVINFYSKIDKENDPYENPNYHKIHMRHPARILISGSSGAGKTNLAINIWTQMGNFEKIYIFSKDLTEPLWAYVKEQFEDVDEDVLFMSETLDDMPKLEEFDKEIQNLIIVDDMIAENRQTLKKVDEVFMRGRKQNITIMMLTQSYFKTNRFLRLNSNYIILKNINSIGEINRIIKDYNFDIDVKELVKMYKDSSDFKNFFMIDTMTPDDRYKFRKNFGKPEPKPKKKKTKTEK